MKLCWLRPTFASLLVAQLLFMSWWAWQQPAGGTPRSEAKTILEVAFQAPTTPVSPILHGLMTEEISYSYDGGLYTELIRNRAFLDDAKNQPVHWSAAKQAGADGAIRVVATHPLTDKLPYSLEVDVKAATPAQCFRVVNHSYWAIPVKPRTTYRASFYVLGDRATVNKRTGKREGTPFSGPLTVSLESADGSKVYALAETPEFRAPYHPLRGQKEFKREARSYHAMNGWAAEPAARCGVHERSPNENYYQSPASGRGGWPGELRGTPAPGNGQPTHTQASGPCRGGRLHILHRPLEPARATA
jgi:hypothetical protein